MTLISSAGSWNGATTTSISTSTRGSWSGRRSRWLSEVMDLNQAQAAAVRAARSAGKLMRRHLASDKRAFLATQYDIKLDLDVRCQRTIERTLRAASPDVALLREEGVTGDRKSTRLNSSHIPL